MFGLVSSRWKRKTRSLERALTEAKEARRRAEKAAAAAQARADKAEAACEELRSAQPMAVVRPTKKGRWTWAILRTDGSDKAAANGCGFWDTEEEAFEAARQVTPRVGNG